MILPNSTKAQIITSIFSILILSRITIPIPQRHIITSIFFYFNFTTCHNIIRRKHNPFSYRTQKIRAVNDGWFKFQGRSPKFTAYIVGNLSFLTLHLDRPTLCFISFQSVFKASLISTVQALFWLIETQNKPTVRKYIFVQNSKAKTPCGFYKLIYSSLSLSLSTNRRGKAIPPEVCKLWSILVCSFPLFMFIHFIYLL